MPKTKISEYSTTNSSNTDIQSINIDEGCAPSGINNAIRELMVHLKNFQTNASGDGATLASLVVQGTGSFTGAVTMSAGATLSGTNTLSGATVMAASLGTSASPSIYFTSDTNTGIFSPTADTVGVATGGSERLRVDSSGNVGIGTNSPNVKLDVVGSIEATPAATQDAMILAGRAGGTSSYAVTLTPTTLSASRTVTFPDATGTAVLTSGAQTLTDKRITPRVSTTTSSATPTINTDTTDIFGLTAQAADITSFTTNLSGTPTDGQKLWIYIVGTAARAITWGASFEASTVALPTTTVSTNRLDVGFVWNSVTSKWRCVATA